jgi:hypothetical protein
MQTRIQRRIDGCLLQIYTTEGHIWNKSGAAEDKSTPGRRMAGRSPEDVDEDERRPARRRRSLQSHRTWGSGAGVLHGGS